MDWAYFSTRSKWTYVGTEHQLIQNDYRLNCKNTTPGHFLCLLFWRFLKLNMSYSTFLSPWLMQSQMNSFVENQFIKVSNLQIGKFFCNSLLVLHNRNIMYSQLDPKLVWREPIECLPPLFIRSTHCQVLAFFLPPENMTIE